MAELQLLARQIGANERTLRRAVACGAICAERPSPRRLQLALGESAYLREHWQVLQQLRAALRTIRSVRLAVVFGSFARGDDSLDSDIDIAVSFSDRNSIALSAQLAERLSEDLEREVQVVDFNRASDSVALLRDILRDGRVLVDRDRQWPTISAKRADIERAARDYECRSQREAQVAILQLKDRATS